MTTRSRPGILPKSGTVASHGVHAVLRSQDQSLRRIERLLADLSARFVNLPAVEVDAAITDSLRQIALLLQVDRGSLIGFSRSSDPVEITHSWAVDGVLAVPHLIIAERYPWVIQRLKAGHAFVMARVENLPAEAAVDTASYLRAGVRSVLAAPFRIGEAVEGALSLGCVRGERNWPEELVERIGDIATVLGNALAHKHAQQALDAAMEFERRISSLLAALLKASRSEQDRVIDEGLCDLASVFAAERATLWQRVGEKVEFVKTHRWLADGIAPPPESVEVANMPWISAQLVAGSVVRFRRHTDLPAEASADLATLRALNVRAAVMVPLTTLGTVVGALSFATTSEDHAWPEELIPRVRLVGEVFASVFARAEAERREHEAEAQAAHAARVGTMGVFAASLVHELTQPIAASLANAETIAGLLAAPSRNVSELRATAADVIADNRRAGELIQQLRRFLRRGEVERVEIDLREIIDDSLRLIGNEAANNAVKVTVEYAQELPKFIGDRVQIQQVLLNLMMNAFDAVAANRPDARRVTVRARASGANTNVEVADNGRGIDEATLARIFQPFFTTKTGGMGLGLSISRTIVSSHGGTLSVESAPGGGTTFRIDLPLRPPKEAPTAPRVIASRNEVGSVFVIDDDPSMRRALERKLRIAGHLVQSFASAQDFLDRAPVQAGASCIVSDVRMPGLSGLDLQVSLAQAQRDLPTVFISGHGDIATSVHAMKAGAVTFLTKPFSNAELLAGVGEALARSRGIESARKERAEIRARYESLTPREREVFWLVAAGLMNKLIADRLGASQVTIKIHRGRVVEKMGARSVAHLVRMAERLEPNRLSVPAAS